MDIIRYILLPGLAGAIAGLVAAAALIGLDVGALRELILASAQGWLAAGLLALGFMTTFGSAAIGAAVMAIGHETPD